jgi:H+/Cl- antiporter ClcA
VTAAAVALYVTDQGLINALAVMGGAIGVLGGIAWIVSGAQGNRATEMTGKEYLVLAMAVVCMVMNLLGATFTIRRLRTPLEKRREKLRSSGSNKPVARRAQ